MVDGRADDGSAGVREALHAGAARAGRQRRRRARAEKTPSAPPPSQGQAGVRRRSARRVDRVDERLAYIGIGSNLDDPAKQVRAAIDALQRLPRSTFARASRLYRTAPWGRADQPFFVNAAAMIS